MVEPYLEKLTPQQFFGALGFMAASGLLVALIVVFLLVVNNFNILQFIE